MKRLLILLSVFLLTSCGGLYVPDELVEGVRTQRVLMERIESRRKAQLLESYDEHERTYGAQLNSLYARKIEQSPQSAGLLMQEMESERIRIKGELRASLSKYQDDPDVASFFRINESLEEYLIRLVDARRNVDGISDSIKEITQ